ncbi:hypothetical protein DE146DRAFT_773252 [Phaeosphaeria sp. MPI-PUGE-AT-0046c]|nr:hypothetical protein DE146DRAFT_773252 [Phaeosphaeria sp. MPI-PUGE-AT-0046c]
MFTASKYAYLLLLCLLGTEAKSYTQSFCHTKFGTKSVQNVPISTKTVLLPLFAFTKVTITPTTTVTPRPTTQVATSTSTVTTSTVLAPSTSSVTMTATTLTITTLTTVITEFTTATATTTTTTGGTVTISAAAGFTAIKDQPGYVAKRDDFSPREALGLAARAGSSQSEYYVQRKKGQNQPIWKPEIYAQSVQCLVLIEPIVTFTFTTKAKTTATSTLPPRTASTTTTVKTTITNTITPPAVTLDFEETITQTITTATTSTTSATTTTTVTSTVPDPASPTTYEACQPNNFASSANGGQGITSVYFGGLTVVRANAASDYELCVQCQNTANCGGFLGGGFNYLFIATTCSPGTSVGQRFYTSSGVSPAAGFVVGNGPCGSLVNAGTDT